MIKQYVTVVILLISINSDASETKSVPGQNTAYAMQLYHDSLKVTV
jgi:hypothetical protein